MPPPELKPPTETGVPVRRQRCGDVVGLLLGDRVGHARRHLEVDVGHDHPGGSRRW